MTYLISLMLGAGAFAGSSWSVEFNDIHECMLGTSRFGSESRPRDVFLVFEQETTHYVVVRKLTEALLIINYSPYSISVHKASLAQLERSHGMLRLLSPDGKRGVSISVFKFGGKIVVTSAPVSPSVKLVGKERLDEEMKSVLRRSALAEVRTINERRPASASSALERVRAACARAGIE